MKPGTHEYFELYCEYCKHKKVFYSSYPCNICEDGDYDEPRQKLIEEHAEYTVGLFERTYREAFEHGYGHGLEDGKK